MIETPKSVTAYLYGYASEYFADGSGYAVFGFKLEKPGYILLSETVIPVPDAASVRARIAAEEKAVLQAQLVEARANAERFSARIAALNEPPTKE